MKIRKGVLLISFIIFSIHCAAQETDLSKLLPEVRSVNNYVAGMPELDVSTPEKLAKSRAMFPNTVKPVLTPQNRTVNNVRIRVYRPDTVRAVVMEIHGGGWCIGSPEQDDGANDAIARNCKVAVVSVAYRLAPENAYPAQIDDCETILNWLIENAKTEFGTDKIFLWGESAGAHLAILTVKRLRDKGKDLTKIRGLVEFYGGYDLSGSPSARLNTSKIILTKKVSIQFVEQTFPVKTPEELRDSAYSPLYANLVGLPPAIFIVGEIDPIVDDSKFMAARWETAGNKTTLKVYPECPHSFNRFPTKMAGVANGEAYRWIEELMK